MPEGNQIKSKVSGSREFDPMFGPAYPSDDAGDGPMDTESITAPGKAMH